VQLLATRFMPLPVILKTPGISSTTSPAGQLESAVLIADVSSVPLGDSV
jgi:hypothetical protein